MHLNSHALLMDLHPLHAGLSPMAWKNLPRAGEQYYRSVQNYFTAKVLPVNTKRIKSSNPRFQNKIYVAQIRSLTLSSNGNFYFFFS